MTTDLRDGSTTDDRRLDRVVLFDPKSAGYGIRALLPAGKPLRSYSWLCDVVLDQGSEGACVGFAWTHEAAARPDRLFVTQADALALYRRAKQIDPWPGEDYSGTAVIAGAKAAVEKGWLREYRWALGPGPEQAAEDVLRTLGYFGPVVLGIVWHQGDYSTDSRNFITGAGEVVGGHAILAVGCKIVWRRGTTGKTFADLDLDASYVILHNSWGPRFGKRGKCYMTVRELIRRLAADGEACVPVTRSSASQPRRV